MIVFVVDLWFRRGHVVAGPKELKVVHAWFAYKKAEGFRAEQIQSVASDIGATAGHVAYYDLKLQMRDGKEVILAKHLSSKPEAEWLAQQMTAALKRAV